MTKIATILILLMAMLNLVPPLFADTDYFDNSYYLILYLLLSFLGIAIPFCVDILPKIMKRISILTGAWCFSGFVMEIFNLSVPTLVLNSSNDNIFYFKALTFFITGLALIISIETWSKQKKLNS